MFDFRRITLFCLGYRLTKDKMTICAKNFFWGGYTIMREHDNEAFAVMKIAVLAETVARNRVFFISPAASECKYYLAPLETS